jgi:hypothetical protein
MTLTELLDELRENILRDSSGLVSGTSDKLWSDEALVRYINDAYFRFCRLTLSLTDRTSSLTEVALESGVSVYPLDKSVLGVISARLAGAPTDLSRTGHGVLDTPFRTDDSLFFDINILAALPPGKPMAFATDEEDASFRVYPEPSADYAGQLINLRLVRMPLARMSLDRPSEEPEIREEWQLGVLDWAAHKALMNHDVDAEGLIRANTRKKAFEDLVAEAQREARRRRFAGTAWSFGRDGFAWVK